METYPNIKVLKPWENIPPTGPMLRPKEAAAWLGLSLTGYYEQCRSGHVPKPIKIGLRSTGVPKPWLDAVIAFRVTADKGGVL